MNKFKRWLRLVAIIFIIAAALTAFIHWQNNSIEISRFEYSNPKIPDEFIGFTVVQVSDLHNKQFGSQQSGLIAMVESIEPDIIVITGDLIDRRRFNLDKALAFIDGVVDIAPVYFVSGNHEAWSGKYPLIRDSLTAAGVSILDDRIVELQRGSGVIQLAGLSDPHFLTSTYLEKTNLTGVVSSLEKWSRTEDFILLLAHRPELFELYSAYDIDLSLTGHAHGGQFRLPGLGGLYVPDQGFFPEHTSGRYDKNNSTMYVSRGLGNSVVPVRLFNRPEIIVVTFVPNQ